MKILKAACLLFLTFELYAADAGSWELENSSPLNTEYNEAFSSISEDGLTIYISSDRPGGFGPVDKDAFWAASSYDIFVAHRETVDSPWGPVTHLGEAINTEHSEHSPMLSPDGHFLYFVSSRPGSESYGGGDLYASYREDISDDFGWEPAVNLGGSVNTPWQESCPFYSESADGEHSYLYFVQMNSPDPASLEFMVSELDRETGAWGHPQKLDISTTAGDGHFDPAHGYIWGFDYEGGYGNSDIWLLEGMKGEGASVSGKLVNAGKTINTAYNDIMPSLTENGQRLFINSDRPGGKGGFDIYEAKKIE